MARKKILNEDALEARRSRVRQLVTYWVISGYLLLAGLVVVWLLWAARYDLAVGVLSGVAGLAGSIAGFWFGSRGASKEGAGERGAPETPSTPETETHAQHPGDGRRGEGGGVPETPEIPNPDQDAAEVETR